MTSSIRVEHARAAISDLYASAGIDLRGYEHIFAEAEAPDEIPALYAGEVHVEIDGKWLSLGKAISLTINQEVEEIDASWFDSRAPRRFAGRVNRDIELEISITDEVWEYLNLDIATKNRIRVGSEHHIVEFEAMVTRYETDLNSSSAIARIKAAISGEITYFEPKNP